MKISISERSPLSPTLWPREAFPWWGSLALALLLVVGGVVTPAIVVAFLYAFGQVTTKDLQTFSWPLIIATAASYVAWLATLFALLPFLARRPLSALGLRPPTFTAFAWGVGGAIGMILIATGTALFQESMFHLKADEVQVHWLHQARGSLIVALVVVACFAAPFVEEFAFRGFVFNAFLRYLPPWGAVLWSAMLFGLAHFQPGNAGALAPLSAVGIVLATVYYRTGSLAASMISHSLFNTFTVVAVLVFHQR